MYIVTYTCHSGLSLITTRAIALSASVLVTPHCHTFHSQFCHVQVLPAPTPSTHIDQPIPLLTFVQVMYNALHLLGIEPLERL